MNEESANIAACRGELFVKVVLLNDIISRLMNFFIISLK
jgi:hypothetical protein